MRDLQLDDDVEFHRREWRMERAGAMALMVFTVAAAGGAFGDGPLSHARASAGDGRLVVEYDRFVRASHATDTRVRIAANGSRGDIRLWIDLEYLSAIDVAAIVPEPARVEHQGSRVLYVFTRTAAAPAEVVFRYEPKRAGRLSGRMGLADGPSAAWGQFAFF